MSISARCVPRKNIQADQQSHPGQVISTERSLPPKVFDDVCKVFNQPHLDLFATRANSSYTSMCLQFQIPWLGSKLPSIRQSKWCCVPSIHSDSTSLVKGSGFREPPHDPHRSTTAAEGVSGTQPFWLF